MRRPLLCRLALLAACAALLGASTAAAEVRTGGVELGVLGDPARFAAQTGQVTTTRHIIAGWGYTHLSTLLATMGPRPMLGINPNTSISPLAIARGEGDGFLLALNEAVSSFGHTIYIRPMGEMNGHWNGYCAYNTDGSSRGPADSTAAFRKAFARIWLAVHGGPGVDAQLRRLGLPPFRGTLHANRNAVVVWNPQGYGSPDVPGNSAAAYYPGDHYVDAVGDDLYYINGKAEWEAADALYRAHPSKPFMFPEWGLWGLDAPSFVSAMADFVRTHGRTRLIVYYSGEPGSVFDLASKPASRAAYRRLILPLAR